MKILSIDGGGYLGLATASFIEEAERHTGKKFSTQFDLFCGTSTGAIIALALAAGLDGRQIREMYEEFGPKVFANRFPGQRQLRKASLLIGPMYANENLRSSLEAAFGKRTLGDLQADGKRVLVTAFCLTTGYPRIFKTNHGPDLSKQARVPLSEIALASAAAPTYLPIVEITDPETGIAEQFCDGGVFANHPGLLGFTEAIHHCGAVPNDIRLLSLSTPRANLAEHRSAKKLMGTSLNRSALAWALQWNLPSIFIDGNAAITDQALHRLVEKAPSAVYERVLFDRPLGTDMDIATEKATTSLHQLGHETASAGEMRKRIERILN